MNSALHSCLIHAFAKSDRVTMDVEFCCMSNAAGCLVGTLLLGLSHQFWELRDGGNQVGPWPSCGWRLAGEIQFERRQVPLIDIEWVLPEPARKRQRGRRRAAAGETTGNGQ